MDSPPPKRTRRRVPWTPTWDEFLIGLMVDQACKGQKIEKGFKKESWRYMLLEFNKKFNQNLDDEQLRNRYKHFTREYTIVMTLLGESAFVWDCTRNAVIANAETWDRYILEHPEAKPYRTKGLPLMEALGILFGNSNADGRYVLSSRSEEVMQESTSMIGGLESPAINNEHMATPNVKSLGSKGNMDALDKHKKSRSAAPTSSRRRKRVRKHESIIEALLEMAANSRLRASLDAEASSNQGLKNCIEELQAMEGLDDELLRKACEMLKDEKNATIFMTLEGHRRLVWVKEMCDAQ
ncbi:L10-interacting MYB domain-containing protein [Amborella trichopoda]|uniref:Myb/SANT-like domain-containing protein n=1 Tax=Amborella trichopoda TaxID=13333 RepID=W1NZS5_AMBTC|nr:L10-interacting MYB domain-containing protein [Amborella trichopoda]XP_011622207.1 L10-interacting MYB domain-containing protein [Amborella trichopoda]XP_011622208.1 L10-interacting MYB domain-containing protein [Amborella trichopoda]XP_020521038.1 L10-interacting MYB domain-containing protein [Amborella trichopoda]XP_020521039.1 L10-interacting MYB domain-containing protein [Amborella trichopoda]XP_020521040.1 L10-interacting MYB domain-containing protein [Amborella trichopoda]ERN03112.1 |eukprot:XP_006841437.1 L10-interacting MYB domain-containing protein [Amborella trichopoda]